MHTMFLIHFLLILILVKLTSLTIILITFLCRFRGFRYPILWGLILRVISCVVSLFCIIGSLSRIILLGVVVLGCCGLSLRRI